MTPAPPATSIVDNQDEPAPTSLTAGLATPPDTIDEKDASLQGEGQANNAVDRQRSLGEATVPDDEDDEEDDDSDDGDNGLALTQSHAHDFWKFHMRPPDDDEPQ